MSNEYHTSRRLNSRWFYGFAFVIASIITLAFTWNTSDAQTAPQTTTSLLQNYALFGNNRVTIQKSSSVTAGYIGTYADALLTDELTIAPASFVFAPNLEIRGITTVQTAYFNVLNNSSNVVNEYPFPTTPLLTMPTVPTVTPGTQNITVSGSQTLAAGSYNALTVQGSGTVVFTGGVYHFSNITLNNDAQLRFTAPTEIRVANRFYADNRSDITPQVNSTVTAAQIQIGVFGRNASDTEAAVVEFGGSNTIHANIFAPNGLIDVGGSSQIQGSLIGNWIYIGTANSITLASSYGNVIAPAPTATIPPTATATTIPPTATTVPSTATTIPPTATTVAPPANVSDTTTTASSLPNFTVYGTSRVTLQKSTIVNSGYVGTNSNALLTDQIAVAPASFVLAPNLEIRGSTVVQTAYFNSVSNSSAVVNEYPFPTTPILTLPTVPTVTTGSQNITVSSSTQTLAAGNYNTLTVQGSRTVVLTGGVYQFSNIILNSDAQIRFTGATEIRVANRLDGSSRNIIAPQSGSTVTAAQIRIGVFGRNASESETPVVDLGSSNTINANIYAPNGLIDVGGGSQITGSLIANWVYIGTNNRLTLASGYANLTVPAAPTTVAPTVVVPTATTIAPTATTVPPTATPVTTATGTYYVSRNGSNGDGRSWATAWNELNQINWTVIQPGNIIYIDGGTTNMTYQTELRYGKSGTASQPIRIQRSTESGRNGQVVFFGGRSQTLPYCDQASYNDTGSSNYREYGIFTTDHDYITIDGMGWRGIFIHGFRRSGIRIERNSTNLTFRNLEIYNNGAAQQGTNGWRPTHPGINLAGVNTTMQRLIIHDNGHDAIQSLFDMNNINNFRLEQSWLYNGRMHPTSGESWNWCTHTDGIQIFDGGVISGITITETIIGPGFTQGVMLGQTMTSNGDWAEVDNVTMRDVLFAKAEDNNIMGYRNTDSDNWDLERVTAYCPTTNTHCLHIQQNNHRVVNSIFVDGLITFPQGISNYSGNCQYLTGGLTIGTVTDPRFASVSATNVLSNDDYRVTNTNCVGSRITSVSQLLNMP
jgi:hypothetical protein